MSSAKSQPLSRYTPPGRSATLPALLAAEAFASTASSLLILGIPFYTHYKFHWELRENFLLSAAQGVVYMFGALAAHHISSRFGRRRTLALMYLVIALVSGTPALLSSPKVIVILLLSYAFSMAVTWPMLESLVSADVPPRQMARQLGIYNFVWAITGAAAIAASGAVIEHWPKGIFIIPLIVHTLGALLLWSTRPSATLGTTQDDAALSTSPQPPQPEPALLRQRRLALWLSRIALPANYVVISSLMAMLPSLPIMKSPGATAATLLGSVWLAARTLTFLGLATTTWWHERPKLLLFANILMPLAFLAMPLL